MSMSVEGCATVLRLREVAELLGVSARHVERLDSSGLLPRPVRLGRAKRWRRHELTAWLESGAPDRASWERGRKGGPRA